MHHWKVHQNTFDVKPFIWWIEIKWGSYSICQVHQESSWAAYQEWCLAFSFSLKLKHASLKGAPEYIWCEYLECQIVKVQPNSQQRWADFLIEELTHAQAQTQANTMAPTESIIIFPYWASMSFDITMLNLFIVLSIWQSTYHPTEKITVI